MPDEANPFRSPLENAGPKDAPSNRRRTMVAVGLLLLVIVAAVAGSYGYAFPAIVIICGALLLSFRIWGQPVNFDDGT